MGSIPEHYSLTMVFSNW